MQRIVAFSVITVFLLTVVASMLAWEGMAQVRSVAGAPLSVLDDESP